LRLDGVSHNIYNVEIRYQLFDTQLNINLSAYTKQRDKQLINSSGKRLERFE